MSNGIIISPKTKVGELLEAYPSLEAVLIEMSPAFEKLRNPILRKTVARVATLQQIAIVGGLKVDSIVNRLRKETGQSSEQSLQTDNDYLSLNIPDWFSTGKIVHKFDASPVINSGGSPLKEIMQYTSLLKAGEIFEFQTPFIPAPIIDMLKEKGFKIYSTQYDNVVINYVSR